MLTLSPLSPSILLVAAVLVSVVCLYRAEVVVVDDVGGIVVMPFPWIVAEVY
jgi:hypothetical protein